MKKSILVLFCITCFIGTKAQNLISNPSFEERYNNCTNSSDINFNDNFDSVPNYLHNFCVLKDWMAMSATPDVWSLHSSFLSLPHNSVYCRKIYPHSDSTIVGGEQFASDLLGGGALPTTPNLREMIENKLVHSLIKDHTYKFSIYIHLMDTIAFINDIGQIAGINSFGAYFSDTVVNLIYYPPFPVGKFTPQIQINQMVTDTGNWVLLTDSFIAKGGERYVCIGNFKSDSLTGWQLVDSIRDRHVGSYYFFDDVSLIDITPNGVEEQLAVKSNQLIVYPNPCAEQLTVSSDQLLVNTLEVTNLLGRACIIPPFQRGLGGFELNISNLSSGIYFIKATDANGNTRNAKFVKE